MKVKVSVSVVLFVVLGFSVLLILGELTLLLSNAKAASSSRPVQADTSCGPHCGTERWNVKTLTDADHASVHMQPKITSVSWLTSQTAPADLPANNRISPVEIQMYQVEGQLVGFKHETDRDFHIVIADEGEPTLTMIVEIPDPACADVCASPVLENIRKARQDFVDHCGEPTSGFKRLQRKINVTVTGVGFFDFLHGQTGVADNGVELHPVVKIEFPTDTNECETVAKSRSRQS
jgi:hypothetical protein